MLVYRSPARRAAPACLLAELRASLGALRDAPATGVAHGRWVELLIDAGVLEAAVADALSPAADEDRAATRALRALTLAAGAAVRRSWIGPRDGRAPLGALDAALAAAEDALAATALPDEVDAAVPEGYAYYGLYPECYLHAARAFHDARHPARVLCLGIRSIGTSLSAVVGAELAARGADVHSCTVRPRGHAFERRVVLAPSLAARLREDATSGAHVAVVDEGPGLSGSSFAATVETLEALGVARDRIALFPSWDPEPSSLRSERARRLWASCARYVAGFEEAWLESGRLAESAARAGLPAGRLADLSAGRWRDRLYAGPRDRPAVQPQHERRKYLLTPSSGGAVLLKFAGLGRHGRAALDRARRLASAGLTARPLALADGFLATEWIAGEPAAAGEADEALVRAAALHVARLRRDFPSRRPVPHDELRAMMRVNVAEGCGETVAARLTALDALEGAVRGGVTTEVDGRMLPHEWLRTSGGWVKTDALDHHADHFLPACQDAAWDVAGAAIELLLDEARARMLVRRYVAWSGDRAVGERLPFYRVAYLAYRLGYVTLGAEALGATADGTGLRALGRRYRAMLERELAALAGAAAPRLPAPHGGVRLVVFDADGTLRRATVPGQPCPHAPGEWELRPGVRDALAGIVWGERGVAVGVASNQDHVGYGCLSERLARRLLTEMVVEATGHVPPAGAVQLCPHLPEDACGCRKPDGEMLRRMLRLHGVAAGEALFVGDEETDREAARRAGVRFAWAGEFMHEGDDARRGGDRRSVAAHSSMERRP